jgi:hypothetical protein
MHITNTSMCHLVIATSDSYIAMKIAKKTRVLAPIFAKIVGVSNVTTPRIGDTEDLKCEKVVCQVR